MALEAVISSVCEVSGTGKYIFVWQTENAFTNPWFGIDATKGRGQNGDKALINGPCGKREKGGLGNAGCKEDRLK